MEKVKATSLFQNLFELADEDVLSTAVNEVRASVNIFLFLSWLPSPAGLLGLYVAPRLVRLMCAHVVVGEKCLTHSRLVVGRPPSK